MAFSRIKHQLLLLQIPPSLNYRYPFSSQTLISSNETLISSVASILREQRSKSRWNFIKSVYPNGFSTHEVSQIIIRIKNNPRLALRFFIWSEKNSLCNHDLLSYSTIIHILARSRLKSTAQTLILTAIRATEEIDGADLVKAPKLFETLAKTYRLCDSAPFVFDLLIKACLQGNRIDRTVEIVRLLRSRGISPMIGTCNSLIRSVCRSRGSKEGFSIYQEVFRLEDKIRVRVRVLPNVQTFNELMLSFYRDGNVEEIDGIRAEMGKFDCKPNVFTYCVLMAVCCDQGKMGEAMKLWGEMGIKQIKPDIMAYNTLIDGLCKNGEMERAEELFREMGLREIEPTCLTFEHLIRGYCRIDDMDSAIILYKDMCMRDFRPEASTVDAVVRGMCNKNKVLEGLRFFRDVMKKGDFFPSRGSYESLIKGFCEEGKIEEALKLQSEMVGKGFEPDFEIYSSFIDGYRKEGDVEKARKLRNEMLEMGLWREDEE
ncbi:tetratricopeptide repeat (TPR)-like superfamily protein [Tasmannia lanceolata]|uniref:tetratricopeptide repeat (TPR)-like superfamily protein n=1 Tax=Tasmannia lanceolata TaxID=3420 RepID=UPI0040646E86